MIVAAFGGGNKLGIRVGIATFCPGPGHPRGRS
jgi:hypothetical protein